VRFAGLRTTLKVSLRTQCAAVKTTLLLTTVPEQRSPSSPLENTTNAM